jgi:IS30 family transposase
LTLADRLRLETLWNGASALSVAALASELGVHTATIYRELERGEMEGTRLNYRVKDCTSPLFRPRYSAKKAQAAIEESLKKRGGREAS